MRSECTSGATLFSPSGTSVTVVKLSGTAARLFLNRLRPLLAVGRHGSIGTQIDLHARDTEFALCISIEIAHQVADGCLVVHFGVGGEAHPDQRLVGGIIAYRRGPQRNAPALNGQGVRPAFNMNCGVMERPKL